MQRLQRLTVEDGWFSVFSVRFSDKHKSPLAAQWFCLKTENLKLKTAALRLRRFALLCGRDEVAVFINVFESQRESTGDPGLFHRDTI